MLDLPQGNGVDPDREESPSPTEEAESPAVREVSLTDHLNKRLLASFLDHLNAGREDLRGFLGEGEPEEAEEFDLWAMEDIFEELADPGDDLERVVEDGADLRQYSDQEDDNAPPKEGEFPLLQIFY